MTSTQQSSGQQFGSNMDKNTWSSSMDKLFDQYDVNKSGFIEKDKVRDLLGKTSQQYGWKNVDDNSLNRLYTDLDRNNTGRFDRNSLKDYIWSNYRSGSSSMS